MSILRFPPHYALAFSAQINETRTLLHWNHGHAITYQANYSDHELFEWTVKADRWKREGRDVHVYFDNDAHGHVPYNAVRLLELLDQLPAKAHGTA